VFGGGGGAGWAGAWASVARIAYPACKAHVSILAPPYFSTLSNKGQDFRKKSY
jgi:hypothetical protein